MFFVVLMLFCVCFYSSFNYLVFFVLWGCFIPPLFFFSLFFSTLWKSHNSWTGFVCGIPPHPHPQVFSKFLSLLFLFECFITVLNLHKSVCFTFVVVVVFSLVLGWGWGWVFVFVRFCCCWPGVCVCGGGGGSKIWSTLLFICYLKKNGHNSTKSNCSTLNLKSKSLQN